MLKQTFIAICILLLYAHAPALPLYQLPKDGTLQYKDWVLEKIVDGVEFYYILQSCGNRTVVFLKIRNTNNKAAEVSWKEVFTTQLEINAEGFGGTKTLTVQPGEISESNCIIPTQKKLLVEPEKSIPTYIAIISKFGYKDIIVKKL